MWSYIAGGVFLALAMYFIVQGIRCGAAVRESKNRLAAYNAQTAALSFLKAFAAEHPEVNIHTILPREENIKKVLAALSRIEEKAQSVFIAGNPAKVIRKLEKPTENENQNKTIV